MIKPKNASVPCRDSGRLEYSLFKNSDQTGRKLQADQRHFTFGEKNNKLVHSVAAWITDWEIYFLIEQIHCSAK